MPPRARSSLRGVKRDSTRSNAAAPTSDLLRHGRPAAVEAALRGKFQQQAVAGRNHLYGAVGEADYELLAETWNVAGGPLDSHRQRIFGLAELLEALLPFVAEGQKLRVMDLGCGDGKSLWQLHEELGLPWSHVVGVSAEDMRGLQTLESVEPFDLRIAAGNAACDSYVLANLEELDECPKVTGQFDLILSWVTFCWLTDPMGSLELIYERYLRPGGVLVIGSLQLLTDAPDPMDDQKWLRALGDFLAAEGHQVEVFADSMNGLYCWLMIRRHSDKPLRLSRCIRFNEEEPVHEASLKACYRIDQSLLGPHAERYFSGEPVPSTRLRNGGAEELAARGDDEVKKYESWLSEYRPSGSWSPGMILAAWLGEQSLPLGE